MPQVSPYLHNGPRASSMAIWTLGALAVPSILYSILYCPLFILHPIGYALLAVLMESAYLFLKEGKLKPGGPGAAVTAVILCVGIPPTTPFLPVFFALIVALWLVRTPTTGSPLRFNAAMAGRLFLMLAYSSDVVNWGNPAVDTLSCATPLELYAGEGEMLAWPALLSSRISGNWEGLFTLVPGSPGETFPPVLILLGLLLVWRGVAAWRTPLAYLASFAITAGLLGDSAVYSLFTGATLFTAVFIMTDPVSTPMSKSGKWLVGLLVGMANALLNHFTHYTETLVFAVLLGNLFTPLFDRLAYRLQGEILHRRKQRFFH